MYRFRIGVDEREEVAGCRRSYSRVFEEFFVRTKMLGRVELDHVALDSEVEFSRSFEYAEQYPEFQSGRPWQTCMLWSVGGEIGDGVIGHYDTECPATPTIFGEQLPYLQKVIEDTFVTDHLLFARLVVMSDNVLVPHRDFLEFNEEDSKSRAARHRLHIPLRSSDECLFMEDNSVYRMAPGEVWSLDASRMHSAAVLSDFRRVHVILDFADAPTGDLVRFDVSHDDGVPAHSRVGRPPLTDAEAHAVAAMSGLVDLSNLTDVFGIVLRKHYVKNGGDDYVWQAMKKMAADSEDLGVRDRIDYLYEHCMLQRSE